MYELFNKLPPTTTTGKRVIANRQIKILNVLLEQNRTFAELKTSTGPDYSSLKNPDKALLRDLNILLNLGAIQIQDTKVGRLISARLDWASEITETDLFRLIKQPPMAKTHPFLDR